MVSQNHHDSIHFLNCSLSKQKTVGAVSAAELTAATTTPAVTTTAVTTTVTTAVINNIYIFLGLTLNELLIKQEIQNWYFYLKVPLT